MKILTRNEAKNLGLVKFYTGKPCLNGHITERYVRNYACVKCEFLRDKNNKRTRNRTSYNKEYFQENKEKYKEYAQTRLNKLGKYQISLQQKLWREKNKNNPTFIANKKFHIAKRRAKKKLACPKWANLKIMKEIYLNCPEGYHIDHIIPLTNPLVCGLHNEFNLQYLTKEENLSKGNKFTPNAT